MFVRGHTFLGETYITVEVLENSPVSDRPVLKPFPYSALAKCAYFGTDNASYPTAEVFYSVQLHVSWEVLASTI